MSQNVMHQCQEDMHSFRGLLSENKLQEKFPKPAFDSAKQIIDLRSLDRVVLIIPSSKHVCSTPIHPTVLSNIYHVAESSVDLLASYLSWRVSGLPKEFYFRSRILIHTSNRFKNAPMSIGK
jgi:hypothetical protein